ncbi:porin family protein [Hwanghaeella grinnelliae]|uniref:porin family protein n=1 Tax=Hwanghaeella grinnelliae TaxID=2500179 RepID=UPI001386A234|nr:porin family protein [Hwanghaeella grinnelliae]
MSEEATVQLDKTIKSASVDDGLSLAELAIDEGRYEQAVGILSGLLLRAPDNATLKLLLGDLYSRMGSFPQARLYVEDALASGKLTPEQVQDANIILALMAGGKPEAKDPFSMSGSLSSALRFRTNATGGTNSDIVLINDQAVAVQANAQEESDWDWSTTLSLRAGYEITSDIAMDTRGFLFVRKQRQETTNNLSVVQVTPGIRFDLVKEKELQVRVRPYVIGSAGELGGRAALMIGGAGVEAQQLVDRRWIFSQSAEYRYVDYRATTDRPGLENLDGDEKRLSAGATYLFTETLSGRLDYRGNWRDTNRESDDRIQHRYRGSVTYRYPFSFTEDKSRLRFAAAYTESDFEGLDRSISVNTVREDEQWEFDLSNTTPIAEDLTLDLSASYSTRDSNLPNFVTEDTTVSAGVTWRF